MTAHTCHHTLSHCQCHHDHDLCVAKSLLKYVQSDLSEHTGEWWKQNSEVKSMWPITISKTEGKKLLWLDTPEITYSCTSTTNMQGLISKYFEFRHCQRHHDHDLCVAQSLLMLNHTFYQENEWSKKERGRESGQRETGTNLLPVWVCVCVCVCVCVHACACVHKCGLNLPSSTYSTNSTW